MKATNQKVLKLMARDGINLYIIVAGMHTSTYSTDRLPGCCSTLSKSCLMCMDIGMAVRGSPTESPKRPEIPASVRARRRDGRYALVPSDPEYGEFGSAMHALGL